MRRFAIAVGHRCIMCAVIFDAEVAYAHDKSGDNRGDNRDNKSGDNFN